MKTAMKKLTVFTATWVLLFTFVFVSCQKESVTETVKTQNAKENSWEKVWEIKNVPKEELHSYVRNYLNKSLQTLSTEKQLSFSYEYDKQSKVLKIFAREGGFALSSPNAKPKLICKGGRYEVEDCVDHWLTFNVGCSVTIKAMEDDQYEAYGCCDCHPQ